MKTTITILFLLFCQHITAQVKIDKTKLRPIEIESEHSRIKYINNVKDNSLDSIKFEETFNTLEIPPGWQVINNDGSEDVGETVSAWQYDQGLIFTDVDTTVFPQSGLSFWWSGFLNANELLNGLIDEWLITPRIQNIGIEDSLFFWAGSFEMIGEIPIHDSLRVFVSTTDSAISSFSQIGMQFKVDGPVATWHRYAFDLSNFAGEDIYIAVNYDIVNGGILGSSSLFLWLDHFIVGYNLQNVVGFELTNTRMNSNRFHLYQNFPNPFNPETVIRYQLPINSNVELIIFDIAGNEITKLIDQRQSKGEISNYLEW